MGLILTGLLDEKHPCLITANMAIVHRRDQGIVAVCRIGDDEMMTLASGTVQMFVDNDEGSGQACKAFLGLIGSQSYGTEAKPKSAKRQARRPRKTKTGEDDHEGDDGGEKNVMEDRTLDDEAAGRGFAFIGEIGPRVGRPQRRATSKKARGRRE